MNISQGRTSSPEPSNLGFVITRCPFIFGDTYHVCWATFTMLFSELLVLGQYDGEPDGPVRGREVGCKRGASGSGLVVVCSLSFFPSRL